MRRDVIHHHQRVLINLSRARNAICYPPVEFSFVQLFINSFFFDCSLLHFFHVIVSMGRLLNFSQQKQHTGIQMPCAWRASIFDFRLFEMFPVLIANVLHWFLINRIHIRVSPVGMAFFFLFLSFSLVNCCLHDVHKLYIHKSLCKQINHFKCMLFFSSSSPYLSLSLSLI